MIGEAVEKTGAEVAGTVAPILEEQANLRNEAQFSEGLIQHKANIDQALEDIKVKYANNPEAAPAAMLEAIKNSREAVMANVTNPFVRMKLAAGNPLMESWTMKESYQWESNQRFNLDKKEAVGFMDNGVQRAVAVASNPNNSMEEVMSYMGNYGSGVAMVSQKLRAGKNPWMGDEIENKGMRSYAVSSLDGALEARRPALATQLVANPEFNKFLDAKDIVTFKAKIGEMAEKLPALLQRDRIVSDLYAHPKIIDQVQTGELGSAGISALLKKGEIGEKTADTLDQIVNNTAAKGDAQSIVPTKADLYDSASSLANHLTESPSKLVEKEGAGGVGPSANIKDLYKFGEDILSAQAKGQLTPDQGKAFMKDLYYPLVASVLKNHDTSFGKDDKAMLTPQMADKMTEFRGASKIIEGNLIRSGQKDSLSRKVELYDAYFKAAKTNLGQINSKTNAKWTPEQIARAVVGEDIGRVVTNQATGKSFEIIGYYDDGEPNVKEVNATK